MAQQANEIKIDPLMVAQLDYCTTKAEVVISSIKDYLKDPNNLAAKNNLDAALDSLFEEVGKLNGIDRKNKGIKEEEEESGAAYLEVVESLIKKSPSILQLFDQNEDAFSSLVAEFGDNVNLESMENEAAAIKAQKLYTTLFSFLNEINNAYYKEKLASQMLDLVGTCNKTLIKLKNFDRLNAEHQFINNLKSTAQGDKNTDEKVKEFIDLAKQYRKDQEIHPILKEVLRILDIITNGASSRALEIDPWRSAKMRVLLDKSNKIVKDIQCDLEKKDNFGMR